MSGSTDVRKSSQIIGHYVTWEAKKMSNVILMTIILLPTALSQDKSLKKPFSIECKGARDPELQLSSGKLAMSNLYVCEPMVSAVFSAEAFLF